MWKIIIGFLIGYLIFSPAGPKTAAGVVHGAQSTTKYLVKTVGQVVR